jgi:hypothetical protein
LSSCESVGKKNTLASARVSALILNASSPSINAGNLQRVAIMSALMLGAKRFGI